MCKKGFIAAALASASLLVCPLAFAGGFNELPDLGAQALGRGATFVAKADDASALYYNVAGLARQRGTKLQLSTNLQLDSFSFARAGNYADNPTDPATPWGGKPFPVVQNQNGFEPIPMLVATTDFGVFERLTFGIGAWAPPAGERTFPLGVNGKPSPARYDYIQQSGYIFYPTVGAGYRLTDTIDIGLAGHLVVADIEQLAIAYYDPGGGACKNAEYIKCDAQASIGAKGTGFAGSLGILARPLPQFQVGGQVTTPWSVTANGGQTIKLATGAAFPSESASLKIQFPWIVRAGARYIGLRQTEKSEAPFEEYDLEVDATYETWSSAGNPGPVVQTTDPTTNKPTSFAEIHNWDDTFGVRVGGAYNVEVEGGVMSLRAGAFYDSSSTASAYTRIDVNTLPKIAGTLGLGYKNGPIALNVAYAGIASMSRTVTDGDIRPVNSGKDGQTVDGNGKPLPAVNNGTYTGFTHVVSFGVEINFETLLHPRPKKPQSDDHEVESRAAAPAYVAAVTPATPARETEAPKAAEPPPPPVVASEPTPAPPPAPKKPGRRRAKKSLVQ
jgi:long-chain fatty acid transport protein